MPTDDSKHVSGFPGHTARGVRAPRAAGLPARATRGGCLALVVWLLALAQSAGASESSLEDAPPPSEVEEFGEPLRRAFERVARGEPFFPRLRDRLKDLPPFVRDTRLDLHLRTYYFNRRRSDGGRSEATAVGGWLGYHSGWWKDVFALEWKLFNSTHVQGRTQRDGTLLLRPGQRSYTAGAAVANAKLRLGDHLLTAYRQELDLPFVNRQDSRMTPNSFEGITLRGRLGSLRYIGGQLFKFKARNSDGFVSMSEAAGVPGTSSQGMSFAGALWAPSENFSVGAIDYFVEDVFNTAHAETAWTLPLGDRLDLKLEAQFVDQRSVGDDLLTGAGFDTRRWGVRTSLGYRNAILRLAFTSVDNERAIASPYGSDPSYTSLIQQDFERAGEDAWLVGLSYDFRELGLPGLTAVFNHAQGNGARSDGGDPLPDRKEWDLTLDYRIQQDRFRGLWLRLRGSVVDEAFAHKTSNDFRIILNYEIPLI